MIIGDRRAGSAPAAAKLLLGFRSGKVPPWSPRAVLVGRAALVGAWA